MIKNIDNICAIAIIILFAIYVVSNTIECVKRCKLWKWEGEQ